MNATLTKRLDRLHNRPTRYELVAVLSGELEYVEDLKP